MTPSALRASPPLWGEPCGVLVDGKQECRLRDFQTATYHLRFYRGFCMLGEMISRRGGWCLSLHG